jgi:hypothetical protein
LTGPNRVDRAKPGSKLHVLCDAAGNSLVVGVSAADTVGRSNAPSPGSPDTDV